MTNFLIDLKSRPRPLVAAVAVLGLAGVLSATLLPHPSGAQTDPKAAADKKPPVQISSAKVTVATVPVVLSGTGNVLALASVTIKARVDGQLEAVEFKEGQDVVAGQLLARIDPRTYQAQLEQVMAQKGKDEAVLANAEADLRRYGALIKDDAITQQVLDTQQALVRQLRAGLLNDDAQINLARVQLSYTRISAPISGRVGARLVDPGNIVHAADAGGLVVINQIDPIALQFSVPESAFQALNQAVRASRKPLKVQALSRDDQQVLAEGELVLLNNQIDTATGTITLKARFANPKHQLWPGQSVKARITLGERVDVLTVPATALQRGQDGLFVYVVNPDNTVGMQSVTVAAQTSGDPRVAVIERGLSAHDRVVVDGQYRLSPGARVIEAKAATAAGARP